MSLGVRVRVLIRTTLQVPELQLFQIILEGTLMAAHNALALSFKTPY